MKTNNWDRYQMLLDHVNGLIDNWHKYLAEQKDIQDAYSLEYLAANIVEQLTRIDRLNLLDDKVDALFERFSAILDGSRNELILSALKGAEPESLLPVLRSVLDSIELALRLEEDPELEFDLYDQITDCLVKRDDLHLLEGFVRNEVEFLREDSRKPVFDLLDKYSDTLTSIDKEFKENIDVFALASDFCLEYIEANNISGEQAYWWLFDPIHRAEEAKIISLLSLKPLLPKKTLNEDLSDLAAYVNARISQKVLGSEELEEVTYSESQDRNVFGLSRRQQEIEPPIDEAEKYEYPLAARSEREQILQPSIYVLTMRKTGTPEDHRIVGVMDTDYRPTKYIALDIQKILDEVPVVAEANYQISRKRFSISLPTTYEGCSGESIGLPAFLEYLRVVHYPLAISQPIAATGVLELSGTIRRVEDINHKVAHALNKGFKLILVPKENEADLREELKTSDTLRFVSTVKDAVNALRILGTPKGGKSDKAIDELSRIKTVLHPEGLAASEIQEGNWHYFITVTGLGEEAKILIYYDKKGITKPPLIQGSPNGPLVKRLNEIILKPYSDNSSIVSSGKSIRAKAKIPAPGIRKQVREYLAQMFKNEAHEVSEAACEYRTDIIRSDRVIVKQYLNGTLTLEGTTGDLWNQVVTAIETCTEQELGISAQAGQQSSKQEAEASVLPPGTTTWIGVDEAGKGDYFGPLVTAAVLVDASNKPLLSSLGIKDSKNLSDQKNLELGSEILQICKDKCYVLTTMPEKYNQLLADASFQGNSQRLLGWQHRRALENILAKYECHYAICDQFGSEYFINEGLKTGKGTQITIIQRPKAESDLAVAAASILARREYLLRLQKMGSEYGLTFPKGSSDTEAIFKTARTLIDRHGKNILNKIAKVHFKTTKKILGE